MSEIQKFNPEAPRVETPKQAGEDLSPEAQRANRIAELQTKIDADVSALPPNQNRLNLGPDLRRNAKDRQELTTLQIAELENHRKQETDPNKRLEIFKQQQELRKKAEQAKGEVDLLDENLKSAEAKKIANQAERAKAIAAPIAVSGKVTPERLTRVDLEAMNADAKFAREPGGVEVAKKDQQDDSENKFRVGLGPQIKHPRGEFKALTPDMIAAAQRGALAPDGSIMKEMSPLSKPDDTPKLPPQPQLKKSFIQRIFG